MVQFLPRNAPSFASRHVTQLIPFATADWQLALASLASQELTAQLTYALKPAAGITAFVQLVTSGIHRFYPCPTRPVFVTMDGLVHCVISSNPLILQDKVLPLSQAHVGMDLQAERLTATLRRIGEVIQSLILVKSNLPGGK